MSRNYHRTALSSWEEWKRKCAIKLCSDLSREDLVSFVEPQLISAFGKVFPDQAAFLTNLCENRWSGGGAFHFFETYMHSVSGQSGKRWKDWTFLRAAENKDDPLETAIEKCVSCCLSTAVLRRMTEDLKSDASAARLVGVKVRSLSEPISGGDAPADLFSITMDLAQPDPADEVALRELIEIGHEEAEKEFGGMPWDTRVAVLATALGISLDSPEVKTAAGKGKSVLYTRVNLKKEDQRRIGRSACSRLWLKFRDSVLARWPQEDLRTVDLLADAYVQELQKLVVEWGTSEKSLEPLFSIEKEALEH